ncbi:MAG: PorP/SprF family type IX secretion system membrane protein [Flavobacteriales bacterium]|jgi:type IX secretion system PorP/SprF family membrane protein|nr:PorP/SprF family type IX secretion system membrane protein [Flavobacteriales bacterium]
MKNHTTRALLLMFVACFGVMSLQAQQFPVRATGMMNPFQDHPAAAGVLGCMDLHMGYRNQWSGLEGAPQTAFANLHGQKMAQGDDFHGFGGRVESDEAGAWGYTSINFAYAYNLRLTNGSRLAMGLSAGLFQHRLDFSMLDMPDDQFGDDPAVVGGRNQFIAPLLDAGVWFYDRTKYAGLTIQNVTQPSMEKISQYGKLRRHVVLTAGSEVELDGQWMFLPSGQVRMAAGVPVSAEIMAMARYDDLISFGLGYRAQSALLISAQVKIFEYLSVGYAYESNVSPLSGAAPRTHEFVIGINGCAGRPSGRAIPCPAYN